MKFSDIIEVRREYSEKEREILDRGMRWKSATDFLVNDPDGYEEHKKYGLGKSLGYHWSQIPKTQEELVRLGKNYRNFEDFRNHDRYSQFLIQKDFNIDARNELENFYDVNHYGKRTEEFIKKSQEKYRMPDPNRPGHLIPRFNYDKLREIGIDYSNRKKQALPPMSLFCNIHKVYFPEKPILLLTHLTSGFSQFSEQSGCSQCSKEAQEINFELNLKPNQQQKFDLTDWIKKFAKNRANYYPSYSRKKEELKYDYSKSWITYEEVKRDNSSDKTRSNSRIHNIKCKIHNDFFATEERGISCATHSLGESGCPKCNRSESIGEDNMNGILNNLFGQENVTKVNKNLNNLTFKGGKLRFDRYVEINGDMVFFEFDGGLHFNMTKRYHNDEYVFYASIARDIIKNNYCKQNNIKLIRIGYKDSNNMETEIINAVGKSDQMVLSTNYPKLGWNTPDMKNNNPELYRYLKQYRLLGEGELKLMNLIK